MSLRFGLVLIIVEAVALQNAIRGLQQPMFVRLLPFDHGRHVLLIHAALEKR